VEKEGSSSLGVDVERSEASTTSSIRRARGESREGNGGGSARVCHAAEGERKKEGGGVGAAAGPWGWNGSERRGRR
jgi:hypothetical protein